MPTAVKCLLILTLLSQISTKPLSYFSLPLTRLENRTHSVHNINLEINQYIYQIDINLKGEEDYFISLNDIAQQKTITNHPDYRKHPDTVYGIVEYIGQQKADSRMKIHKQIPWNIFYSLRDLLPQQLWVNLKGVSQVSNQARKSQLTQGQINLASSTKSHFLSSLKLYNSYFNEKIVTFKLNQNSQNGTIYFGAFPQNELESPSAYSEIKIENTHLKNWKIKISSITLKNRPGNTVDEKSITDLSKQSTLFALTLSQKTLQIPKQACLILENVLEGCSFQTVGSQKLFTCPESSFKKYQNFVIELHVFAATTKLEFALKDLQEYTNQNKQRIFNIQQGADGDYHISSLILKDYMVGLNYGKNSFLYGKKGKDSWLDRFFALKIFIGFNAILFILSVLVLYLGYKLNPQPNSNSSQSNSSNSDPKSGLNLSKASGYEMAVTQQQKTSQIQEE